MNDTSILTGCIIALLMFNLLLVLYNENPAQLTYTEDTNFSIGSMQNQLNDSGTGETSTGLKAVIGFGKFILNLFFMMFWYFSDFNFVANFLIKIGTYIFALPIFIISVRLLRGVG